MNKGTTVILKPRLSGKIVSKPSYFFTYPSSSMFIKTHSYWRISRRA